jgi:hypothetical protein
MQFTSRTSFSLVPSGYLREEIVDNEKRVLVYRPADATTKNQL